MRVDIGKLRNWDKNPRVIDKDRFEELKKRIRRFGQFKPLIVTKDGEVIGGNMRLRAYKKMGIKKVWVSYVDPKTEAEKIEIALADNEEMGYYQDQELVELLEPFKDKIKLKDYSIHLGKTTSLEYLLDHFGSEPEEDEVPEVEENPTSKLGKIYKLGRHRLMCGDATKSKDVEKLMDGKKADMVFTDPPYNVDYEGMQNSKQWDSIANDAMPKKEFEKMLYKAFSNINTFSKGGSALYICHADKSHIEFRNAFEKAGYGWRATIIWAKNSPAFNFAQYKYKHEPIFYCFKSGQKVSWFGDRRQHTIWEADKEKGDHPTIKPISLITKAIKNSSKVDDIVIDLFGGSGSTLIACEQANRDCYMMELDPRYCDVIRKRYKNYKNRKITGNDK